MAHTPQYLLDLPRPEDLRTVETPPNKRSELGRMISHSAGFSAPQTPWRSRRPRFRQNVRSPHEWVQPETNTPIWQWADETWHFIREPTKKQREARADRAAERSERRVYNPTRKQTLDTLRLVHDEEPVTKAVLRRFRRAHARNNRLAAAGKVAMF
jgi:hypothetical protein